MGLPDAAIAGLRMVAESIQTLPGSFTRAGQDGYSAVATLNCQINPPGYNKGFEKSVAPHLRSLPLGTVKVPVGSDVRAKDRLTLSGRLFEVIAPLTPRSIEIRLKFIVREIHQPERELYLALMPQDYDGTSQPEPLPELVRVLPIPFITDKVIEQMVDSEGKGVQVARLKQVEVAEVAYDYFTPKIIDRLAYLLVVESTLTPNAEDARDRKCARFRFNGSPSYENHHWSSQFPWGVALVEER